MTTRCCYIHYTSFVAFLLPTVDEELHPRDPRQANHPSTLRLGFIATCFVSLLTVEGEFVKPLFTSARETGDTLRYRHRETWSFWHIRMQTPELTPCLKRSCSYWSLAVSALLLYQGGMPN